MCQLTKRSILKVWKLFVCTRTELATTFCCGCWQIQIHTEDTKIERTWGQNKNQIELPWPDREILGTPGILVEDSPCWTKGSGFILLAQNCNEWRWANNCFNFFFLFIFKIKNIKNVFVYYLLIDCNYILIGGIEAVTKDRKWAKIANKLGYPSGRSVGSILKSHYERILYPFDVFKQGKTLQDIVSNKRNNINDAAKALIWKSN